MERRRNLKRKKEDDNTMSEQDTGLPSVRARISKIETRLRESGEDASKERKNQAVTEKRKRFSYPGSKQRTQDQDQQPLSFTTSAQKTKSSVGTTDFEAHLQEVWSVRKNIHHKQSPVITNAGSKTSILQPGGIALTQADKYSRHGHGAIPSQPTQNRDTTKSFGKKADEQTTEVRKSPLQEQNSTEKSSPWNVRKSSSNFRFSETAAAVEMSSPAALKRRGRGGEPVRICREDFEPTTGSVQRREHTEKVNYAKSMAKGYLRSVGIGEYAPQRNSYCKDPESPTDTGKVTKWKRTDSDEFDF